MRWGVLHGMEFIHGMMVMLICAVTAVSGMTDYLLAAEQELCETSGQQAQSMENNAVEAGNHRQKGLSEKELLRTAESVSGRKMYEHVYVDMDHDGAGELIGICCDDEGQYRNKEKLFHYRA